MKRTDDLRKFWDSIAHWEPDMDEDAKWQAVRKHGASRIDVLHNDKHQQRVLGVLLENIPPKKGDRVIDFGCGVGRISRQLSLIGCVVKAIDVSPKVIDYARDYCGDTGSIEFLIGDGHGCENIPDAWADKIVSAFVFQHMPTLQVVNDCLIDLYRVLKSNGKACIQSRYKGNAEGTGEVGLLGVGLSGDELGYLAENVGFSMTQIDDPFGNPEMGLYRILLEKQGKVFRNR